MSERRYRPSWRWLILAAALSVLWLLPAALEYRNCRSGTADLYTPSYCRCYAIESYSVGRLGNSDQHRERARSAALSCAAKTLER